MISGHSPECVFKAVNPKYIIPINLDGVVVDALLLKYAYKPLAEGKFAPRRDRPEILEPARRWNYCQELPIIKSRKLWAERTMPIYAVVVEEIRDGKFKYDNAIIVRWSGDVRITQAALAVLPVEGTLSGSRIGNTFQLTTHTPEQVEAVVNEVNLATPSVVETNPEYTGDKFSVDPETGHVIGDDGFRVPRNFEEFWERYPLYIRNWSKKHLHKNIVDEDVEDWEMELYTFLKYLPEKSKHREPGANGRVAGCTDVIETFDPVKQYGASEKRFRNYVNNCLSNRFNTIMSKRSKNPVCRPGNYSLSTQMDPECYEVVDDEYVHSKSQLLTHHSERELVQTEDRMFLKEFRSFINQSDPDLLKVLDAIAITGTFGEAARELNVSEADFNRARNRIKTLRDCWLNSSSVPKQRRPYQRRKAATAE